MVPMVPGDGNACQVSSAQLTAGLANLVAERGDLGVYARIPVPGAAEPPAHDADLDPLAGRVPADHRAAGVALAGVDAALAGADRLGRDQLDAGLLVLGRAGAVGDGGHGRVVQSPFLLH